MIALRKKLSRRVIDLSSSGFLCLFLSGCGQAPSVEVIGSFFPVWMLCLAIAIALAFALRYLLLRYKLESEVGPLALFYPSAVIFFTSLLWLIFFR